MWTWYKIIKVEKDKIFLELQRELGWPGCLGGIEKKISNKGGKIQTKIISRRNKKIKAKRIIGTCIFTSNVEDKQVSNQNEMFDYNTDDSQYFHEDKVMLPEVSSRLHHVNIQRGRKNLITTKVVAVWDRCQLSIRDSVYIIQVFVEALDLRCEKFSINKSSIQQISTRMRKSRTETI